LNKKVLVAMSGGVDSSVAALLLKEQGYEPAGVTMDLGVRDAGSEKPRCCGPDAIGDARRVCFQLGIPHYVFDYAKVLEEKVIGPFIAEYARGRTPNPCVDCNRRLKFGALLDRARALGFDYLATGHYADIEKSSEKGYLLKRPKDRGKDQTYFLYRIAPDALASILFPLACYSKNEVREMAVKVNLPVTAKGESQDICFVTHKNYQAFVAEHLREIKPGWIVDKDGKKLGEHRGIVFYTVGQRGGLGISHKTPLYVVSIDASKNRIIVGEKRDLRATGLTAGDLNILVRDWPQTVYVKIRYRKQEVPCKVIFDNDRIHAAFADSQDAVTPGQSAVFYDDKDTVLGGGIIEEVTGTTR
jgi:tRNA-uridine 2-sulfurtransferase